MQTFTFKELMERTWIGDEVFVLYPAALDEIQKRNERNTELTRALKSCAHVLSQMMLRNSAMDGLAKEALNEADKALALMVTGAGK